MPDLPSTAPPGSARGGRQPSGACSNRMRRCPSQSDSARPASLEGRGSLRTLAGGDVLATNLSAAPGALDFSAIGLAFTTLSPELKQPFFIGDGLTWT